MANDSADRAPPVLNELIQTCVDGEQGFQAAARLVEDLNLRRLFESYAQQRAEFAAELQLEVRRLSADPVDAGHATAALHRTWLEIKAGLTGRDEGAVISECERGEEVALKQYQEAASSGLPADLKAIVERQCLEIKHAHDHIRSLERAHSRHA